MTPGDTIRHLMPVAVTGAVVAALLFCTFLRIESGEADTAFRGLAEQRIAAVTINVAAALDSVDLLAAHFAASRESPPNRTQFRIMVAPALASHPFIQALEWVPAVPLAERDALERQARAEGLAGFHITERDAGGGLIPAAARPAYFPVAFVEPRAGNEAAVGFDLASNPPRRAALEAARDQGRPLASAAIRLVQEKGDQFGFLVFAPVFEPNVAATADDRRRHLAGFALGVFRIGDLIAAGDKDGGGARMVRLDVFDDTDPAFEQRLYPSGSPVPPGALTAAPRHVVEPIEVAGRHWRIVATPTAEFQALNRPDSAYIAVAATLLITALGLLFLKNRITQADEHSQLLQRMLEGGRFEALGTLAGGIAHEINTPTQYIGDNLSFLRDTFAPLLTLAGTARTGDWAATAALAEGLDLDYLNAEIPAALDQAADGVARISKIVQAIREFSHPGSVTKVAFDLNHMIQAAATVTRNQWKYVAEMVFDLAPDLPRLTAVEGEINQILINLIVNAAQAIEAKTGRREPGTITLTTRGDGGVIVFSVADTGVGIPADLRHRIFEMFFTTKPPGSGTGQGLAISRAIAQRHGGGIEVVSEPNKGSCFTVRLPATPPAV